MSTYKLSSHYNAVIWFVIMICILFFFSTPVDDLLNTLLVKPLFSKFNNTVFSNVLLIISSFAFSIWLIKHSSSYFLIKLAVFVFTFYCTQRWNLFWKFHNLTIISKIYVWDIISLSLVVPALKIFYKKKAVQQIKSTKGFVEDIPITNEDQDHFKYSAVAKTIADEISVTKISKSFAIGITGPYGSGKTSFINLILSHIDGEKMEIITFNPWHTEKNSNIQKDLLDLLASHLYHIDPKISNLILNYSRKISRINSKGEQIFLQLHFLSNIWKEQTQIDDYKQIDELLSKSSKKIIVVIDDVDRLYDNEVVEVLRLIRNTANFSNIFYLVAYEHNYVQNAIRALNPNVSDNYLDKIIQLQIPLPKREIKNLLNLMENVLQTFITEEHLHALQKHLIPNNFKIEFPLYYGNVFRTSRDVIKFVNGFKISYALIGRETFFDSLFVLELLKFRFPDVYDLLYEQRSKWLIVKAKQASYLEYYELKTYKDGEEEHLEIKKFLNPQYSDLALKLIDSLLRNLFVDYKRHKEAKNAIIYPAFFEPYFRFRLSENEISEYQFLNNWAKDINTVIQFINHQMENNLTSQIIRRLFQVSHKSRDEFEKKIECLFYCGPYYVKLYGKTAFDDGSLLDDLWDYDNHLSNKYYDGNIDLYVEFINQIFEKATFPFIFENEIIYRAKHKHTTLPLPKEELTNRQITYFKKHIESAGITDDAMWLMFGIREEYLIDTDDKELVKWRFHPTIVSLMKKYLVEMNPLYFLRYTINFNMRSADNVAIYPQILEMFDNPIDLRTLVLQHPILENNIKADYLKFFDKCEKVGFDKFINHRFVTQLRDKSKNDEDS